MLVPLVALATHVRMHTCIGMLDTKAGSELMQKLTECPIDGGNVNLKDL